MSTRLAACTFLHRAAEILRRVIANAGLLVGRDVGSRDLERRLVERQKSGEGFFGDIAARPFRGMAVAAGQHGVDEIIAPLDQ